MPQSCVDCHVEPAIDLGSGKRCPECFALATVDLMGATESSRLLRQIDDRTDPVRAVWWEDWRPIAPHLRRFIELNPRV